MPVKLMGCGSGQKRQKPAVGERKMDGEVGNCYLASRAQEI